MQLIGFTLLNTRNNCCIKDGFFTVKRELAEYARIYKTSDESWEDCVWWRNKDIPVVVIEVLKED